MFPQVRGNPDAADYVQAPARAPAGRGEAPGIAEHVAHPAAVDTVELPGGASPRRLQRLDETKQRLAAFAKIGDFRWPVILLGVDVEMIIASPAHVGCQAIVPEALQVHRQRRIFPRAGHDQVAPVLEE